MYFYTNSICNEFWIPRMARSSCAFVIMITSFILLPQFLAISASNDDEFSVIDYELSSIHGDYSPPSPPPPISPPHPPSISCEDLKGIGNLDSLCLLNTSLGFDRDVYIEGRGSLNVGKGVVVECPNSGCSILVNLTGEFIVGENSYIIAGSVKVYADNTSLLEGSVINTTALGGSPPAQTSGTPAGIDGAGGGHGGRGATCLVDNLKLPEDMWGGDAYAWSTLDQPDTYGSKGGTSSREVDYGGGGGGKIWFVIGNVVQVEGSFLADGGDGGQKGGGGSGGSIFIKARKMIGNGMITARGGNGFAGGGGGRISINVFSRHDDPKIFAHGGKSFGCPKNSGAAGTFYDAVPRSLTVSNNNMSTDTDTLFLEFPHHPLWTNVYIKDHAKAMVPLFWSRLQVCGQLSLLSDAVLSLGLVHVASSEFELMAEELLMSDSVLKIYGALRMSVKVHLMLNSQMLIDGDGDSMVATSSLEASNLLVLKGSSVIHSNANLGVHGQGWLNLTGPGNSIEAQRLILSLFYGIKIEPGSHLQGPLKNASDSDVTPRLHCDLQDCPAELLHPPEDCNVNSSLSFTLQICRVEDVIVKGAIKGSVIHFHLVRTARIHSSGTVSASRMGCKGGVGRGEVLDSGYGGGGGHGGRGGDGYYNGSLIEGGLVYGDADLPCELGSGSGNDSLSGATAGGGIIVMGSLEHSLSILSIDGSLSADGESFGENSMVHNGEVVGATGPGGGSGGTILLFVQKLGLGKSSTISTIGGHGSFNSGGGGGGRVHFHWSDISVGDEYVPIARVDGSINTRGGLGRGQGLPGENGTLTGKACPKGLFGIFCEECPVGTFKNVSGSDSSLCQSCPAYELPSRAVYTSVRGGVSETPCPYKCISDRYHMPHCYTALEELIYTFGGPWLFGLLLLVLLILLALVLSVARMKFVSADELPGLVPTRHRSPVDYSFPFLESLNEVLETNRVEESQNHVHRMYFMGPNTFSEPWHLAYSPPEQVTEIVYEDAFNRFVDEINGLAAYQWWEGSIYSFLSVLAYPLAWSWLQWRRNNKFQKLREFVQSEYDHACLRSCRSRALYEGLKVAATSDLILAYVDFFLGGDEKRPDLPPKLHQRFPMSIIFGGDGSYMAPFSLQSDNVLTSLMSQSVPPTIWYRLVAGLNAQLRLVRRGYLRMTFRPVIHWLESHANPTLKAHGVRVDLAWFQPTVCGYCQFGLLISAMESEGVTPSQEGSLASQRNLGLLNAQMGNSMDHSKAGEHLIVHRRMFAGILHAKGLLTFKEKKAIFHPLLLFVCNSKPVGHQDHVGLVISILLLGDFSLVLLTLLQMYSISLEDFFLVLFILPLGMLFPFPAGINALFSQGSKKSAGLARVYALWNVTSLINVMVAFICGIVHRKIQTSSDLQPNLQPLNFTMDESEWWMLPVGLTICKIVQARLIDFHVANQEIQDRTLYSDDLNIFWQS
ncbi:hypothetical protein RJ641_025985 [Dillenia turbinata]|uniref:DUF8003 domain-containing protein n=1 Tax=Dillenia turbinata TaxID=194707 RepID=A0AAN8ZS67_9MAGN